MNSDDFHHATYQKNCHLLRLALPYLETPWVIDLVTTALMIPKTEKAVRELRRSTNSTFTFQLQKLQSSINRLDYLAMCIVERGVDHWTIIHGEFRKELKKMNLLKPKTPIAQNP